MMTAFLVLIYVCFRYVCAIDPQLTKVMAVVSLVLSFLVLAVAFANALRHLHP